MSVSKTKAKRKTTKPLTLKQVLNVVDVALQRQDKTAKKLWQILTALRGPDRYDVGESKGTSTIHIRRAAFPKTTKWADEFNSGYIVGASFSSYSNVSLPDEIGHFNTHAREAMFALGLFKDPYED